MRLENGMKKSRIAESQILSILMLGESGYAEKMMQNEPLKDALGGMKH